MELALRGGKQARKPSEARKEPSRDFDRALPADAGAEEERDELRILERSRAVRQHSFARPLGRRPSGQGHAVLVSG